MIQSDLQRQFLVRVSFLEIYNEEIRDLLSRRALPLALTFCVRGYREHVSFGC